MKTFKLTYQETTEYEFLINAESKEDVHREFMEMVNNLEVNFDSPNVISGDIVDVREV